MKHFHVTVVTTIPNEHVIFIKNNRNPLASVWTEPKGSFSEAQREADEIQAQLDRYDAAQNAIRA